MHKVHRTSFGLRLAVQPELDSDYASAVVHAARCGGHVLDFDAVVFHFPESFGFCHGVERAVQLAYETRRRFPDARLFLVDEIVHNPLINRRLIDLGYRFLQGQYAGDFDAAGLGPGDVVVLPAFGVEVPLVKQLSTTGATLVDTTCGEVMSVWKRVREYARQGYTAVIHGAFHHQETRATASRAVSEDPFTRRPLKQPGRFLVVRDFAEAESVCRYIEGHSTRREIEALIAGKTSAGFDVTRDLERIGIANQTTMLARETLAIQTRFREAFTRRHGPTGAAVRLLAIDTICSATQDRQDALSRLLAGGPDLLLVVGGYNSSNTGHLAEMGRSRSVPTFHVAAGECIVDAETIRHFNPGMRREVCSRNWVPARRPLHMGVCAGASTPDSILGEVILRAKQVIEQA